MTKNSRCDPVNKRSFLAGLLALSCGALGLVYFRPDAASDLSVRVLQLPLQTRVNSVAFSPDSRTVVLAVERFGAVNPNSRWPRLPGQAQLWDVVSATHRRSYECRKFSYGIIDNARFSVEGQKLSFGGEILDLRSGQRTFPFQNGGFNRIGLLFSPDKKTMAGASKNALALWNLGDVQPRAYLGDAAALRNRTKANPAVPFILSAAFSPEGRYLVTGHTDGEVLLWDVQRNKLARVLGDKVPAPARSFGANNVVFSCDGHTVAAVIAGEIIFWDARNGKETARWNRRIDVSIFGIAFSPDGKTLASGGPNFSSRRRFNFLRNLKRDSKPAPTQGEIDLWDVPSGRLKSTLRGGTWINCIAFSPDGKWLATSGDDNTARIWAVPR